MSFAVNVFGLGKSGAAAVELCLKLGHEAHAFDEAENETLQAMKQDLERRGAKVELSCRRTAAPPADLGVVSPGVGEGALLHAMAAGMTAPVISEMEFGARHCECPMLAVTGTNGKTTVTEMTEHILCSAGKKVLACGNIGYPLSLAAMRSAEYDVLVVEVSSFQLERLFSFAPRAAVLLNITSDHLDRHGTLEAYARIKYTIFKNVTFPSSMILRSDLLDEWRRQGYSGTPTLFSSSSESDADFILKDGMIWWRGAVDLVPVVSLSETSLRGSHNAENLMAAAALAWRGAGVAPSTIAAAARSFKTGPHRIEKIAEKDGVSYINDSKSTTPDSTVVALRTVGGERNVCLILGGLDKDMDFSSLLGEKNRIKIILIVGKCSMKLAHLLSERIPCLQCGSFENAVTSACDNAKAGDVVLLSPACASMDMFKNYIERGETFKNIVNRRLTR